jgi:thiosulfate/3-mercaptopyruvate sulfurtransferase
VKSLFVLCLVCLVLAVSTGSASEKNTFVSAGWLADHLGDPDIVVLHVAFSRPEYKLGHIPGARFLWYDWLSVSTPDASTEMPSNVQADSVLGGLGISEKSRIVLVFSGSNVVATARVLLALTYFGLGDQTSILDGGLEAWKEEKRPVSTDPPRVARTNLTTSTNSAVIVNADWVQAHLASADVAIVDARDKRFYDGNGGGISRTGHIRGARSIPYSSLVDSTNRIKNRGTLQQIFDDAGIHRGTRVISYCHVGQQASLVYAIARELGYNAAVYDGSFQEWNLRSDMYPVDKTDATKK